MQRISRAPELSATLSFDSCWIIAPPPPSLRLLEDLDQAPALPARDRPRLDDPDEVALARLVPLVVGMQRVRAAHDLLVHRVAPGDVDPDRDRLVGLVRDDGALAHLAGDGPALRRRRPSPPFG